MKKTVNQQVIDKVKDTEFENENFGLLRELSESFPIAISQIGIDHEDTLQEGSSVKRRKRRSTEQGDRQNQMTAKMEGIAYKGWRKMSEEGHWKFTEMRPERILKPRGCLTQCQSSQEKCCNQICELDRNKRQSASSKNSIIEINRKCMLPKESDAKKKQGKFQSKG